MLSWPFFSAMVDWRPSLPAAIDPKLPITACCNRLEVPVALRCNLLPLAAIQGLKRCGRQPFQNTIMSVADLNADLDSPAKHAIRRYTSLYIAIFR